MVLPFSLPTLTVPSKINDKSPERFEFRLRPNPALFGSLSRWRTSDREPERSEPLPSPNNSPPQTPIGPVYSPVSSLGPLRLFLPRARFQNFRNLEDWKLLRSKNTNVRQFCEDAYVNSSNRVSRTEKFVAKRSGLTDLLPIFRWRSPMTLPFAAVDPPNLSIYLLTRQLTIATTEFNLQCPAPVIIITCSDRAPRTPTPPR